MTAYFAFSYDLIDTFQVPERAFKTLMKWKNKNFNDFFTQKPLRSIHLYNSAALMLGTTSELKSSLEAMLAAGMEMFTVDQTDFLVVHYLRIQRFAPTPLTRSLICVAALRGWWGTDNYQIAGTRLARGTTLKRDPYDSYMVWRPLFPGQQPLGIYTRDLIDIVVPDAEDKAAWLRLMDP